MHRGKTLPVLVSAMLPSGSSHVNKGGLPGLGPVHRTVLLLNLTEWVQWSPHWPLCNVVNPIRQE